MTVIDEISAERRRQIDGEGWTTEHDDRHRCGEMAMAAALYAAPVDLFLVQQWRNAVRWLDPWPWFYMQYEGREQGDDPPTQKRLDFDKRHIHNRRRRLVIAAALIVAEVERIDRASPPNGGFIEENGRK